MAAGFALQEAWTRVRDLDRRLEGEVGFCFSEELGYMTGCPTNVGTGLRASVMLHLPGLGLVRSELEKVFTAAHRTGLAVRGMYGEGSRAAGDLYQISNQVTLGCTEEQLIADLESLVPCIVEFERKLRRLLLDEQRRALEERVQRSLDMLRTARSLPTDVALVHLSNVRLGACLGLLDACDPTSLNRVTIQVQKGHVHALSAEPDGDRLHDPTERDRLRASFLRQRFAGLG
jgi:protein arginine kinase